MGLVAVLMIFVGSPLSGATSAPELLPQPAGLIGQRFPPTAGANLVRSVTFFDGNGAQTHLLVLSTWVLLGLLATVFGARLRRQPVDQASSPAAAEESRAPAPAASAPR